MALPGTATLLPAPMDPADTVDYSLDLSPLLLPGEAFATVGVTVLPESLLLGFQLGGTGLESTVTDNILKMWFSIASGRRSDAGWTAGQVCGMEVDVTTDSVPPRKYQRSFGVTVKQL